MNAFTSLSDAIAEAVAAAAPRVVALHMRHGRSLTATVWHDDLVVASEQALPKRDRFPVRLADGSESEARVVGRDEGTNVALLRLATASGLATPAAGVARLGGFVLTLGAQRDGGTTASLGVFNQVGPAWQSSHGGRIDQHLRLDLAVTQAEEGGPVLDAAGGVVGVSVFGPRGEVLVIPHATIERVLPVLADHGRVARGWLGATLQPVAVPGNGPGNVAGQVPGKDHERPERGYLIASTAAGGPAEVGGIVPGDILVSVDGKPLGRTASLTSRLGPDSLGQGLDVEVLRGGERRTLSLVITERPANDS